MSPRARKPEPPPKRARGRPPIDPGYDTVSLPAVRISRLHFTELMRLIHEGALGTTLSDVIRGLIEESARRHSP